MDSTLQKSVNAEKAPPSKKTRAPPQVRQTLASKYRMLKSNPLLVHELEKKYMSNSDKKDEPVFFTPLKTLVTVLDTDSEVLSKFNISYNPNQTLTASTTSLTKNDKNVKRCESNKEISKREFVHPVDVQRKKLTLQRDPKKNQLKESQSAKKLLTASVDRNLNVASSYKNLKKDLTTRKFPATTIQKTKSLNTVTSVITNKPLSNFQGGNVHKAKLNTGTKPAIISKAGTPHSEKIAGNSIPITPNNKPTLLNAAQKSSVITTDIRNTLTPTFSAKRNSLFVNTPNNKRKSIFVTKQTSNEMTQNLSEWLKHKGKSFKEYHRLKCFGVHVENTIKVKNSDVEKENVENVEEIENNNLIKEVPVVPTEEVNLSVVAQEALVDLYKLILDGYPPEQCEIWLKLIKQKCVQVEEESQYWECRAALEQTKGNINLAVECYKTAIIQGAEVQNVDKCLDQLLQKFSLLNINETDSYVNKKDRNKIVQDARNIFKSSIIQFAVQEKVLKKRSKEGVTIEKRVVATPVRRSTRLSRSAFTSTPGIHIYSSLQEVDTCTRDNLNFQCNYALKE